MEIRAFLLPLHTRPPHTCGTGAELHETQMKSAWHNMTSSSSATPFGSDPKAPSLAIHMSCLYSPKRHASSMGEMRRCVCVCFFVARDEHWSLDHRLFFAAARFSTLALLFMRTEVSIKRWRNSWRVIYVGCWEDRRTWPVWIQAEDEEHQTPLIVTL